MQPFIQRTSIDCFRNPNVPMTDFSKPKETSFPHLDFLVLLAIVGGIIGYNYAIIDS